MLLLGAIAMFVLFSNRFLHCCKVWPATPQTSIICARRDVIMPTPFKGGFCSAINSDVDIAPCVVILHKTVCPNAVPRRIPLIVISALNSCFWEWLITHINVKRLKRIPSITDGYATPTIIMIRPALWIIATLSHTNPCAVFRAIIHTMFSVCFSGDFFTEATATFYMAVIKMINYCRNHIATITSTIPIISITSFMRFEQDNKPTVSFSG